MAVLTPQKPMSLQEKLWWCLCIRANRFRFHFGRQANRTIGSLVLPDDMPDWAAAQEMPSHAGNAANAVEAAIDPTEWESFNLPDIFDMQAGKYVARRDLERGETPLITASAWNNGVTAYIADEPDWNGGQITLANNGSIGAAFFQPRPFSASRDVTILQPKFPLSPASALFICTILRKESDRFNYARKWNAGRMRESKIRLPSHGGSPDTKAM
ncbi:MAG: restriction endonuclease subunit S, partial [Mesorhizobium sp.]